DLTFRALDILKQVDYILAEDTRQAYKILKFYQFNNNLLSLHLMNAVPLARMAAASWDKTPETLLDTRDRAPAVARLEATCPSGERLAGSGCEAQAAMTQPGKLLVYFMREQQ
ncbi:MAG: hypothetical protein Q8869_03375, partial [Candidatus Phytoplasma australasiaticum]|nr:hypothetical protein [Candidatus Phytoplasma australasiaticum]